MYIISIKQTTAEEIIFYKQSYESYWTLAGLLNILTVGYVYIRRENVFSYLFQKNFFLKAFIVFSTKRTHLFETSPNFNDAPEIPRKATFQLQSHYTQKSAKSFSPDETKSFPENNWHKTWHSKAAIYSFKFNNENTRSMCKIYRHNKNIPWLRSGIFVVNFEHIR